MVSAMDRNICKLSTIQEKAIWWLTEEYGLEVYPVESNTVLERYTLDVILHNTGGQTCRNKAHLLSNMSVCHWNDNPTSSSVGTQLVQITVVK